MGEALSAEADEMGRLRAEIAGLKSDLRFRVDVCDENDRLRAQRNDARQQVAEMHAAALRAAASLVHLTQPKSVKAHPRYTLLDREAVVPVVLALVRDIDAIRARGGP